MEKSAEGSLCDVDSDLHQMCKLLYGLNGLLSLIVNPLLLVVNKNLLIVLFKILIPWLVYFATKT